MKCFVAVNEKRDAGIADGAREMVSYFEIEIIKDRLNLLERAGDGNTRILLEFIENLGVRLKPEVDSPCG
ncbi:MAG TPA: hypothetical protein GXX30_01210 [Firmicutes bacterium]|nr:hypothetical protein [Candidatus Fermentithermobacillaceae bacterium]